VAEQRFPWHIIMSQLRCCECRDNRRAHQHDLEHRNAVLSSQLCEDAHACVVRSVSHGWMLQHVISLHSASARLERHWELQQDEAP